MVGISQKQRHLHILSEAVALVTVVPFSFYLATRKELPPWARWVAGAIGAGTLIVDGYLLSQYMSQPCQEIGERFAAGELAPAPVPQITGLLNG